MHYEISACLSRPAGTDLDEFVVGINVVHGFRRHQLVLHEHGRGTGSPMQDVERQPDDRGA